MKQVLIKKGIPYVAEVPAPQIESGEVLVCLQASCLSIGTELNGIRASAVPIWKKAITQPEKVLTVLQVARDNGIKKAIGAINEKKEAEHLTGYSASGVVIAIGDDITDLKILITKISKVFMHCFIAFIKYPLWLLILVSVFIQLFFINKIDNHSKYFLLCLLLNLIFIVSIFFTFRNFDFMLKVSLDRLLFQTSGFYIILLLLTIKNLKFLKK